MASSFERTAPASGRARARAQAVTDHQEVRHAVKYGIVGVANVAIDLTLYAIMIHFGVFYVLAKALSVLAANANGYFFNRTWTFRAGDHEHIKLIRYATVQGSGMLLNIGMVALLVEVAGAGEVVSAAIAIPFVAAYCFALNRLWTFGEHIIPRA